MEELVTKKGNDYSNEDRLSNFKEAGATAGNGPEINCLNLIGTKVARIKNLIKQERTPDNESIADSLVDLANYSFLLGCIIKDKNKQ